MNKGLQAAIVTTIIALFALCAVAVRAQETIVQATGAAGAPQVKIIPAPKKVTPGTETFTLDSNAYILLCDPASKSDKFAADLLRGEIKSRLALDIPVLDDSRPAGSQILIGAKSNPLAKLSAQLHGIDVATLGTPEGYVININNNSILLLGADADGAFYAVQSLRQLLRSATGPKFTTMRIEDWPDFHFRGITDDISRGPIPTMDTIKLNIARLAEFKVNKFNFYIEHVFCFEKHPDIGPEGGCLSAADLKEIEAYAAQYHIELVGGMQSFGHQAHTLSLPKYAPLAENPFTPWSFSPAKPESYKLIADLYSEIVPPVSSKYFNISCDETFDLGTGQSKAMVEKQGIADVYAGHINKLGELLTPYNKVPMMWADIALKHPDILWKLPKNLIFLAWTYGPRDNFDDMLKPIADTKHQFLVCPGVNCWSRIFPNLNNAIPNIANFARDGKKFGAFGVLNTTWDDDGENLFGYNWFPLAWGGEASWNPDTSNIDRFKASFPQAFYGTAGNNAADGFDQFIEAEKIMDFDDLGDSHFWAWPPDSMFPSSATAEADARRLLKIARRAVDAFSEAKKTATANAENLDYPLFSARRLEDMANRRITWYRCARAYAAAVRNQFDPAAAGKTLDEIQSMIRKSETSLTAIRDDYKTLWLRENRPYWLDKIVKKYDDALAAMAATRSAVAAAKAGLDAGKPLPAPESVGLLLPEMAHRPQQSSTPDQPASTEQNVK